MELVAQYTQRTLVLGMGKVLLDAPTREVFNHVDLLHSTFIEPPEIIRLAQTLCPDCLPSNLLTVEEVTQALLDTIK
jgi:energy-coupling factor transport system ATP-binding protein